MITCKIGDRAIRLTTQRRVILEELGKTDTHPTADEIYEKVRLRLPRISLGTVYRNLEILSQCGMIRQLATTGAQKRFDGNVREHYHLRCVRCGAVLDCPLKPVISFRGEFRGLAEYEILGHRLEFIGLCPQCRSNRPGSDELASVKDNTS